MALSPEALYPSRQGGAPHNPELPDQHPELTCGSGDSLATKFPGELRAREFNPGCHPFYMRMLCDDVSRHFECNTVRNSWRLCYHASPLHLWEATIYSATISSVVSGATTCC